MRITMQVAVFLLLKAAYLFTAAESSDLEVSCLSAFWVLLLVPQLLILTQTCFTIWWPNTQHFNKNNPLPQRYTIENISILKSLSSNCCIYQNIFYSLYKIRSLKELPVYSIFVVHSNPSPSIDSYVFHIRQAMKQLTTVTIS